MTLFSYVVEHDTGHAPNPYFGVCTLCRCKYRKGSAKPSNVVELAEKGDWIVGTGGANLRRSAGHGKLVYAMRVDKKLTREKYYSAPRFAKKRVGTSSNERERGDNIKPRNNEGGQFALISRHFYYLGANAIDIPKRFLFLEKKGPGFKKFDSFGSADIRRFVKWLEDRYKSGKHGEPCKKPVAQPSGSKSCKLSC